MAAPQQVHPNTRAKEDGDTYVYIRRTRPPRTPSFEVAIFALVGNDGLNHTVRDYLHGNFMPHDLMYRLRFPALMFIQSGVPTAGLLHDDFGLYFRDGTQLRPQFGTHLFVGRFRNNPFGQIIIISTLYRGVPPGAPARPYHSRSCCLISAVYPCYKRGPNYHAQNNPNDLEMVLGMCFNTPFLHQPRTFSRFCFHNGITNNEVAFDIPQSFIDINAQPPPGGAFWNNFQSREGGLAMFPMLPNAGIDQFHNAVAFYVCQGARLIVMDTRFSDQANQLDQTGPDYRHSRGLYFNGSVCVVKGTERMGVNINLQGNVDNHFDFSFGEFLQSHLIPNRSPDLLDNAELGLDNDPLLPQQTLGNLKNKVIFLGAVESQYNSVCWLLNVERPGTADPLHQHKFTLYVPEGGVITDISSWRAGFHQIYWRHRYERLYESILVPRFSQQPQAFNFQVPDDYYYRRMLGLPNNQVRQHRPTNAVSLHINAHANAQTNIPHPPQNSFLNNLPNDRDVRKYVFNPQLWWGQPTNTVAGLAGVDVRYKNIQLYNQDLGWPNWLKYPPLTPPLYPPLKRDQNNVITFRYLVNDDKVVSVKGKDGKYGKYFQTWKKQNQYYQLDKCNIIGFPWVSGLTQKTQKNHVLHNQNHKTELIQWTRLGMDYSKHYKWADCTVDPTVQPSPPLHTANSIQKTLNTWYLKKVLVNDIPTAIDQTEQVDWNNLYF